MAAPVRICVIGSANVDLIFRTARLPAPGETLTGSAFTVGFGGKGANQAVMAARLGAQVSFIARLGKDTFGQEALQHYRAEGLDTTLVHLDAGHATGVAGIVVDDAARNCILVIPGANAALSTSDVQEAGPALRQAEVVVGQLEVPLATICSALAMARSAGRRTILNPAPAQALPEELLQATEVCVPNETEMEALTGLSIRGVESAIAAAQLLRRRGVRAVIVTLGERGIVVVAEEWAEHIPALEVAACDSTGAGDAFIGSLAVFWAEGDSLLQAARRANVVAALTVTRPGTQSSFPARAAADAFLARHGMDRKRSP